MSLIIIMIFFFHRVENTVGKRNAGYFHISIFFFSPHNVFKSLLYSVIPSQHCVVKGMMKQFWNLCYLFTKQQVIRLVQIESICRQQNKCYWKFVFFSLPEHIVLRVSYCDRSLSGVRPSVREQLLKNSSPLKPPNRFQWNFTEMILRWCTFKILQRFEFHGELWLPWQPREKTLKIFLSQTVRARALIFCM